MDPSWGIRLKNHPRPQEAPDVAKEGFLQAGGENQKGPHFGG